MVTSCSGSGYYREIWIKDRPTFNHPHRKVEIGIVDRWRVLSDFVAVDDSTRCLTCLEAGMKEYFV